MRAATLFSGIGAPECAAPWLGWRWSAEIDPFASAVHAARFPGVPNLGDVNRIDPDAIEPVDLVVFGSPCQSFSVAGKRLGLDDPRGNLALVALRLVERLRPRWFVFENVPGLLSSDAGRDFGAFLGTVEQCGYGWAYRTLDAQFAGVPQRRRRVFVVGCLGDWRGPAAVLFEPESLRGDPPPRREAGKGITPILEAGARTGVSTTDPRAGIGIGHPGDPMFPVQRGKQHAIAFDARNGVETGDTTIAVQAGGDCKRGYSLNTVPLAYGGNRQSGPLDVATAVTAHGGPHGRLDFESETFVLRSDAPRDGVAKTPSADAEGRVRLRDPGFNVMTNAAPTVDGGAAHIVAHSLRADSFDAMTLGVERTPAVAFRSVRRLTPRECERLQGFPDDFTAITYRGKPAADGPRYRALGNSMAVPIIGWVLGRIREFAA